MKKRDIKKRISQAYRSETPDLRARVLSSCRREAQEHSSAPVTQVRYQTRARQGRVAFQRVAALALCLLLFVAGWSVGMLVPNGEGDAVSVDAETFVYLDVNPSIELRMDGENRIVECLAANEDAEAMLAGLTLEGVDMNTALTAIVGSMYVNGYLTEDSNSILISVDGKDEGKTGALLSDITSKINTVFVNSGLECSIIAQSVKADDDLKQRAKENGISVGKMYLVDKMVGGMDDFDTEDVPELADMSIKDLNLIYSTRPNKNDENDPFSKDVSSGDIGGIVQQNDALALLLASIELDPTDIEWHQVQAKPQRHGESRRMVYHVAIRVIGDASTYEFEVDCLTGDVVKIDANMPNIHPSDDMPQHDSNNPNAIIPNSSDGTPSGWEQQADDTDAQQSDPDNEKPRGDADFGEK